MNNPESGPSSRSSWKDRLGSWSMYAAAAGAALASATSAEAEIVYTHPASPLEVKVPNVSPSGLTGVTFGVARSEASLSIYRGTTGSGAPRGGAGVVALSVFYEGPSHVFRGGHVIATASACTTRCASNVNAAKFALGAPIVPGPAGRFGGLPLVSNFYKRTSSSRAFSQRPTRVRGIPDHGR